MRTISARANSLSLACHVQEIWFLVLVLVLPAELTRSHFHHHHHAYERGGAQVMMLRSSFCSRESIKVVDLGGGGVTCVCVCAQIRRLSDWHRLIGNFCCCCPSSSCGSIKSQMSITQVSGRAGGQQLSQIIQLTFIIVDPAGASLCVQN